MSSTIFQFKEFSIEQKHAAMKVGTDSILLGAWVDVEEEESILDVGTGTGLLALMMAQRSEALLIDAVEIEDNAFEEAVTNFENSPWGDRLYCYHTSIQEFAQEMEEQYDLILANPPYFDPSKIISSRSIARQTHTLTHMALLKATKALLCKEGKAAFIIPYEIEEFFINLAKSLGLEIQRITRVKDTENSEYKRSLLQFGFEKKSFKIDHFVLKNQDNTYSQQFIELTQSFYLNL
jgi:tRNA1Val (adenine37-N6)-methyltransferase